MQNLSMCELYYPEGSAGLHECEIFGFRLVNLGETQTGINGGNPFANLGLISDVTNDIADIYACATTEEQAYCVSKAKSYGIFTGVNGSVYNKCVADICAAKQPELTNLLGGLATGIAATTVVTADALTPLTNLAKPP